MKFKNNYKNTIVQIIGGVLKRAYGEDYQSVLTMFMDTPYPTPDALVELTKEQRKQLEDRFTFCINQTAIYDTIDELISFLTQTAEKLRKTHTQIKEAGRIWLDSFLCDDKDSFLHFAIYIRYATMFRVDVENFIESLPTHVNMEEKLMISMDNLFSTHSLLIPPFLLLNTYQTFL